MGWWRRVFRLKKRGEALAPPVARDTVIHAPRDVPCPRGWTRLPDAFTLRDGRTCDAWVAPREAGARPWPLGASIDYLGPGETFLMPAEDPRDA